MKFEAVGIGIAEQTAVALRNGAEGTLLDDLSRDGLAAYLGRPGTIRFAAYDGGLAVGLVALLPNGTGQADATIVRFAPHPEFAPSLKTFTSKTMDFAGWELVRAYSIAPLEWLSEAGFRHDGQLRRVWRPATADPSLPMQDIEIYSITLAESRLGETAANATPAANGAAPIPPPDLEPALETSQAIEIEEDPNSGLTH